MATLPPQSALTSVDLPTFGRPATAMKPLLMPRRLVPATARNRRRPPPGKGWGCRPATHTVDRIGSRRTHLRQFRAESSRVELPRLRQQVAGRVRHDLAGAIRERHAVEPELPQPLPTTAARRGGDPDRLEIAGPASLCDRARDRRLLRADPKRVRRVLHVHALEHAPVARERHRTDEVLRIRRVRPRRDGARPLDELRPTHANTWNNTSVMSAPSKPPYATSTVECTPASIRVCATSSAMMNVRLEIRKRCSASLRTYVAAIQPANAIAAWPEGNPPRNGVPRPLIAFVAMTTMMTTTSEMSVSFAGASRSLSSSRSLRFATCPENTR